MKNVSPHVVQVKEPTPRGLFSRLIWRFLRYAWLESEKIYLTIIPPTEGRLELKAAWIEGPGGSNFAVGVTSPASVGFTDYGETLPFIEKRDE